MDGISHRILGAALFVVGGALATLSLSLLPISEAPLWTLGILILVGGGEAYAGLRLVRRGRV